MSIISLAQRFIRQLGFFLGLALLAGVLGAFVYTALLPRLSTWPLTARIAWPGASLQNPTVIERTEQVVLSQEEGLEQFSVAPRASVVSVIAIPVERVSRSQLAGGGTRHMSGLLVTNDGLVATYLNEAPLSDTWRYTVFFSDGTTSAATLVAYDSVVHVAFFRTERSDTPAIAFANSADIRQGRRFMVLAGTTDESGGKLATGYIGERARTFNLSAKTVGSTDEWEGVLLPDRPLDSSFVGGAAVAMNGELIGLVGSLTVDGLSRSFFLPSNAVRQSLQRVINGVSASRVGVGAYYVSLTRATALSLGVSRDQGALIYTPSEKPALAVISGSLAERAGLQYGDIVTAVNGQTINADRPLSVALYEAAVSRDTELTVLRAGSERTLTISRS